MATKPLLLGFLVSLLFEGRGIGSVGVFSVGKRGAILVTALCVASV